MAFLEAKETDQASVYEELVPMVRRNLHLFLVLAGVVIAGVYATLVCMSNQYESSALMLVMLGRENSQPPVTAEHANIFTDGVKAEEINSYVRLMSSRSLIEDTVDALGLDRFERKDVAPSGVVGRIKYCARKVARWGKDRVDDLLVAIALRPSLSDREKAVKLLERSLVVARERDSNVIRVSLRLADPALAKDAVQQLINVYSDRHISLYKDANVRTAFDVQTEDYRKQMADLRQKMTDIRTEWNITAIETQRTELATALIHTQLDLEKSLAHRIDLENQQQALEGSLIALGSDRKQSEQVEESPTTALLKNQLALARVKRAEAANHTDKAPDIKVLDAKIAEVEALINKENPKATTQVMFGRNPLADDLVSKITGIKAEIAGLDASAEQNRTIIANLQKKIDQVNDGANALELAQLDYSVLESRFKSSAERLEQVKIEQQLDAQHVANTALIGGPTFSDEPVAPKRLLLMGVGVVAALALSFSGVFFKEWLMARVYGRREIEAIAGVKYLGSFHIHRPDVRNIAGPRPEPQVLCGASGE